MIVTFCGHRNVSDNAIITDRLTDAITNLFLEATTDNVPISFYCGGYGEFDRLAENVIDRVRNNFPNTRCEKIFVTPYITQSYQYRNEQMKRRFNDIIYPPIENVPYRYAIIRRNEWMVDSADIVIAYVKYSWGGAARTLEYARRKKKNIIQI